jgi:GTP cyclohydrolase IA
MAYMANADKWEEDLLNGVYKLLHTPEFKACISEAHTKGTPKRFVESLKEYFQGVYQDPRTMMTVFPLDLGKTPQMIHVEGHKFYSMCAHHWAPFFGRMHFAYLPAKNIVGLSKIPRLINVYARRPQVQEKLTDDIVDMFQEIVQPAGCGLLVRATHFCMESRGVQAHGTRTTTTALRGIFTDDKVKNEFLMAANRLEWQQ